MTFPLEWRIATHAFIDICHMGTKCARDEGEEGRMQQVCPPYKKYLIHSCNLLMSYLALKHMFCNSYWARGNKDSHAHLDIIFYLHVCGLKDSVCSLYQCWAVLTFLWEPSSPGFLMMLWEPDRFSNIYIYILGWWDQSGYQKESNSPRSRISRFSYVQQQPVFTTWLLKFSLINISFINQINNYLITPWHEKANTMPEK
jgi:hypothetical protein